MHLREDFPEVDDEKWQKHITLRLPEHERTEGVSKVTGERRASSPTGDEA